MRRRLLIVFLTLLWLSLFWLSTSCRSENFTDLANSGFPQRLELPLAEYRSVAWLDNDTIAFVYKQEEFGNSLGDFRIAVYSINTGTWRDIPRPENPEDCPHASTLVRELRRSPDGRLAYIFSCSGERGVFALLYAWDKRANSTQLLQHYSPPFRANAFTFDPDMSELLQDQGAGMSNKLFRVNLGQPNQMEQLFQSYQRVGEPSWSPDGITVAFAGTEVYPREANEPQTWNEIEDLLRYPWDLYLMNADGSNVRIILPEAGRPYQLKWSPENSELLAFAGDSQGTEGIWLLDINTLQLTRLWAENTFYDWSPDGQQMVVIDKRGEGESRQTSPIIVDISVGDK